jgi:DNA mismatch endonuclease, patch repair protein
MRGVRSKDTSLERQVRRELYAMGYRYRLHSSSLPGRPDIVFPRLKKVVFIHGCFWHQHAGCDRRKTPRSNTEYWLPKLRRNIERDRLVLASLNNIGWKVAIVWECEVRAHRARVMTRLTNFLERRR